MLKLKSIFKNGIKISKESSPNIKITEKSTEGLNKKRNMSLDFSNTPLKQNKKIIKRNTRTNSFNSLQINQTESGIYQQYPYLSGFNSNFNHKLKIKKNLSGFKVNYKQKNKSFNLKKGIININRAKLPMRKKNTKKKRNYLNSFFINPSNIHISFNTVGNNFQFEHNLKQNKNHNMIKNELFHNSNIMGNNKLLNNSDMNKSIHLLHKTKSTKKLNIYNELNNILNSCSDEQQKMILNEFKLFLIIYTKIKKNKNEEIVVIEKDLPELKKGGLIGHILCENLIIKRKNEELESKINIINKELEEVKKDKNEIKKELENKDNIIKDMNIKMNSFNDEVNKLQNIIKMLNSNKNSNDVNNNKIKNSELKEENESLSSQNCLENISLADNLNINEESYKYSLNKNGNINGNNLKINNKVGMLNLSSKVGSKNFNDEFLKDYENFSESWRKEVDKMLQRRGNNKNIPGIKLKKDNAKK